MASGCVKTVGASSSHAWTSHESEPLDHVDFEFLLEDPVAMLSADELFSNGKLVPLKFSGAEEKPITTVTKPCRRLETEISGAVDPYLFSPRAPRCTVRWRELLGLKRSVKTQDDKTTSSRLSSSSPTPKTASFRHFLNRNSKSTSKSPSPPPPSSSNETEVSWMFSSRLSLSSSSSSGHELDDLPRSSLDSDKPRIPNPIARSRDHHHHHVRKPRRNHSRADESTDIEIRSMKIAADSPRLNACGKIVFHGLERSSSSPGNFTGGPRLKHHRMPRSYSANVRIAPVLNVPVSSLRNGGAKSGLFFGQFFSSSSSGNKAQLQSNITKNRTGI
ncbi:unnamed protein product [Cochlearia groenlandica]